MKAMNNMGSSVVVGIASTKLLGVMVLAFAPSTLFRLYYFRMYLFIIILGVWNGLFFLPVFLSFVGPATVSKLFLTKLLGRGRCSAKGKRFTPNEGNQQEREIADDAGFGRPGLICIVFLNSN